MYYTHQNIQIQKEIEQIVQNSVFPSSNRHLDIYMKNLNRIIDLAESEPDRAKDLRLLAFLLLKKIQQETYTRWVFDSGDICIECSDFFNEYERQFKKYISSIDILIDQLKSNTTTSKASWELYQLLHQFASDIASKRWLIEEEKPETKREWKNKEAFQKSFFVLYPIFDPKAVGVESYVPMHYSDEFGHGFFHVSHALLLDPDRFFPAMIHEAIHYIPPASRADRNEVLIDLLIHAWLIHFRIEVFDRVFAIINDIEMARDLCTSIYQLAHAGLKRRYVDESDRRLINNQNTYDSMNMSVFVPEVIYRWTPDKFVNVLCDSIRSLTIEQNFRLDNKMQTLVRKTINDILDDTSFQNNCKFIWKYEADSYATSLNNMMRELRSDLIMSNILDMSMERYFKLMVSEPNFANSDDASTADSIIMRIGLISRLLYKKDANGEVSFPDPKQNSAWIEQCESILNNLKQNESNDQIKKHIDHIRSYLNAYNQIAIEESDRQYMLKGCSLLETSLSPLIKQWNMESELYRKLPIVQKIQSTVRDRYNFSCTETSGSFSEKEAMGNIVEHEIELLLRSFPAVSPDKSDICRARTFEKRTVGLYRSLPHITYVKTLDNRNYREIYENSFSHQRNRMDECGRISLASIRRKG